MDRQSAYDTTRRERAGEDLELACGEQVRELDDFELDAPLRFVGAVTRHRVRVLDARKRTLELHAEHVAERAYGQVLEQIEHVVHADERQLQIELRELELPIGALIFVAEAARELEVRVEARDHQHLLQDLG